MQKSGQKVQFAPGVIILTGDPHLAANRADRYPKTPAFQLYGFMPGRPAAFFRLFTEFRGTPSAFGSPLSHPAANPAVPRLPPADGTEPETYLPGARKPTDATFSQPAA